MKKKQIITLVASLSLVGAVTVGGTLAYLSAQSNTVQNTFTVGKGYVPGGDDNLALKLDEQDVNDATQRTMTGNEYKNLLPGDVVTKDPTVYLTNGSIDSYVFVKVEGIDELEAIMDGQVQVFDVSDINDNFVKVDGLDTVDGIYLCKYEGKEVVSVQDTDKTNDKTYVELGTLFNTVSVNFNVTTLPSNEALNAITVKACAVQAAHVNTVQDALKLAHFE